VAFRGDRPGLTSPSSSFQRPGMPGSGWPTDRAALVKFLPVGENLAGALNSAWRAFGIWRHTRPFWGGLVVSASACEIMLTEHGPLSVVIHIGIQGLAGYLIPFMLLLCGILLWFSPGQRPFYSLLAIVLSLGSWLTSNLGGFFLGMLLGLVGGVLAFAWTPDSDDEQPEQPEWPRGHPQILQPSWVLEMLFSPSGVFPPIGSAESGAGHDLASWAPSARPIAARPRVPLRGELIPPDPVPPEPVLPELAQSESAQSEPAQPEPAQLESAQPEHALSGAADSRTPVQEPADASAGADCGEVSAGDRPVHQDEPLALEEARDRPG
jgi:hypothetical protein